MMNRWWTLVLCASAATAAFLFVRPATAGTYFAPADLCHIDEGSDNVLVANAGNLVSTSSGGSVACGISLYNQEAADDTDDVFFWYDDNDSQGSVYCFGYSQNYNGSTLNYHGWLWSCSTVGGCTSSSSSFTGSGYLGFWNIDRPVYAKTNFVCHLPGSASKLWTIQYNG